MSRDFLMDFGYKIKLIRKTKGYTQKKFAELLECATISLQQYELGKREPKSEFMKKLCKMFPQYTLWIMTDITNMSDSLNQINPDLEKQENQKKQNDEKITNKAINDILDVVSGGGKSSL
jgi:transcriptional regulator with XRE-family HTH domain